ncbi:Rv1355c family protein [Mycobacterium paragordonae]|uniref:Rv1355c family protein n=1 Tax=Mycobacterium paragordonae TaxID=1389713 RepID=A0A4V3AXU8_9MYCO|nr:Rv1355c family protein [Mycobacterium paragordonae]MDP7733766.1 Rv1355c family protein [Mycobacterium paragordonae]TDL00605.1 Rv1355c family protein [Mycobacterium paragordonae]TDL09461.1 Rv1355c family protein [Mycobacterium paragordonae]
MTDAPDGENFTALVLCDDDPDDRRALERLRSDQDIHWIDRFEEQLDTARRSLPPPDPDLPSEAKRWVYYPWRRTVAAILGPRAFRAVRLDRNRHLITAQEQGMLNGLRVGVVGVSAGHAIAYTLAAEGACGTLRLADFDELELSNLNRVPATVLDIGLNKAIVAARRIAELDPYLKVEVVASGLSPQSVEDFLDGLDVVIEECDSLDMKVLLRQTARARGVPVLMATTDRGLIDVERYDIDPGRPILHGLLGEFDADRLSGLTTREKVPYILNILDSQQLSSRGAASLVEVGQTLSGWPQLAGDIWVGAATVTSAVRRIGLGEPLDSGRVRVDVNAALDRLAEPARTNGKPVTTQSAQTIAPEARQQVSAAVAEAAMCAPSGGNAQPWHVVAEPDSLTVRLVPERTSMMDIAFRGSAVALGAAMFNARIAAAAHQVLGPVEFDATQPGSPLQARMQFGRGADESLAALYQPMLLRATNRYCGTPTPIDSATVALLEDVAANEGARLQLLVSRDEIDRAAAILAAADRVRYLTPRLHEEMISELRWPGDPSPETGIDVASLELEPSEMRVLELVSRADVIARLAQWDAGAALGTNMSERVAASSALAIIYVKGAELIDFARGGSAMQAVWIAAQQGGLAVQPVSPVFLYGCAKEDLQKASPHFAAELYRLQHELRALANPGEDEHEVLVFRLFHAPPPSVRSRRRRLGID